jgi:hypothetical protein
MTQRRFRLAADVSTDDPAALRPVIVGLLGARHVRAVPGGFRVECELRGESAKDLNRTLLSALRRTVKKTRLRAEWTTAEVTERFFDYVSKGIRG